MESLRNILVCLLFLNGIPNLNAGNKDSVVLRGIVMECQNREERPLTDIVYVQVSRGNVLLAYAIVDNYGTFTLKISRDLFKDSSAGIMASQFLRTEGSTIKDDSTIVKPKSYFYYDTEFLPFKSTNSDTIKSYHFCMNQPFRCGPVLRFFFELRSTKLITDYMTSPDSTVTHLKQLLDKYPTLKLKLVIYVADEEAGMKNLQKSRLKKVRDLILKSGVATQRIYVTNELNNLIGCDPKGKYASECHTHISIVTTEI